MAAGLTDTARAVALGSAHWPDLAQQPPLLVVPVGSVEQHGPHLPLATDAMIATAVARAAVGRRQAEGAAIRLAPTVSYGASGEHQDFPGTLSVGNQVLALIVTELTRSASTWAEGIVFVNGHGGNLPTLGAAVRRMREEGHAVAWTSCAVAGGDAHAGHTETSLLLWLAPDSVRTARTARGVLDPIETLLPRLRRDGVRAVSPTGVLGDPTTATEADGRAILHALVERLTAELRLLDVAPDGRLRTTPSTAAVPG